MPKRQQWTQIVHVHSPTTDYFIKNEPCTGEVKNISKHDLVGVGTVKYTVVTDSGDTTDIIIKVVVYVPTLDVRLLSNSARYPTDVRFKFWGRYIA